MEASTEAMPQLVGEYIERAISSGAPHSFTVQGLAKSLGYSTAEIPALRRILSKHSTAGFLRRATGSARYIVQREKQELGEWKTEFQNPENRAS